MLLPVSFYRRAAFITKEPELECLQSICLIDLNRAGEAELTLIPGIGQSIASAIVQHRNHDGPFRYFHDIQKVSGVGPSKALAMADWVLMDDQGKLPVPIASGMK